MTNIGLLDSMKYGGRMFLYVLGVFVVGAGGMALGGALVGPELQNWYSTGSLDVAILAGGALITLIGLSIFSIGTYGLAYKFIADATAAGVRTATSGGATAPPAGNETTADSRDGDSESTAGIGASSPTAPASTGATSSTASPAGPGAADHADAPGTGDAPEGAEAGTGETPPEGAEARTGETPSSTASGASDPVTSGSDEAGRGIDTDGEGGGSAVTGSTGQFGGTNSGSGSGITTGGPGESATAGESNTERERTAEEIAFGETRDADEPTSTDRTPTEASTEGADEGEFDFDDAPPADLDEESDAPPDDPLAD